MKPFVGEGITFRLYPKDNSDNVSGNLDIDLPRQEGDAKKGIAKLYLRGLTPGAITATVADQEYA